MPCSGQPRQAQDEVVAVAKNKTKQNREQKNGDWEDGEDRKGGMQRQESHQAPLMLRPALFIVYIFVICYIS